MSGKKICVAHFAAFCPNVTGQYATVKDLIKAERSVGIDAQFIATSINNKRIANIETEKKKDGWLESCNPEWAKKADVIMRHSCIPDKYKSLGIPIIMCLHGRPESTFIIEFVGLMKIYKLISEVREDSRYKGWITFWEEHRFFHEQKLPKDRIYYVPAMVDLDEYNPKGKRVNFTGSPKILIADMWRHDTTPYTMLYAAAKFKEQYCPESEVHVVGVPEKKADSLIRLMKKNGVITNMTHRVKPMSNVYRGADLLITPHNIATRVIREALACGLPVVSGEPSKYTKFAANPKNINAFAEEMNKCWKRIKKDSQLMKKEARETAEREFNIENAGKAVLAAIEDVLEKEKSCWAKKNGIWTRNYKNYKSYINHQKSKIGSCLSDVGDKYRKVYRQSLVKRMKVLEKDGRLNKGMNVLCLGARDGTEVRAFRDVGCFAVGIDILPISKEEVLLGDFQKIKFPDNSADVVFMNCIDHVYDIDGLLKSVINVLKTSGFFIVDFGPVECIKRDRWASLKWDSLMEIGDYIKNSGFSIECIQTFNDNYFTYMICFRSLGGLTRTDIINSFIREKGYKSYLEIGVKEGENFNKIVCEQKYGIDPNYSCDYEMTSDKFFESCNSDRFDIIFIDGDHKAEQVLRDIKNSLEHLNKKGTVLIHDCNPPQEYLQGKEPEKIDNWTGDGWKAFARMRMTRDDLSCYVINRDYGMGVITRTGQNIYADNMEIDELDWKYLQKNRQELLRLREPEEWMTKQ